MSITKRRLIDYLEKLGLCELEITLYVTLLETGPIAVRDLADIVRIKRTRSYMYINTLLERGLIVKVVNNFHNQVMVNTPDFALEKLAEEKVKSVEAIQLDLPEILHHLHSLSIPEEQSPAEIKYYKGKAGVKKIYEEVFKVNELRSYVNIEAVLSLFPENAKLFDDAIKNNSRMRIYEIVEDSLEARERVIKSDKRGRYFYKFLPENIKMATTDVLIYDGKVSIINLTNKLNGIVLHNSDLFNSFKQLFDFLWKVLP